MSREALDFYPTPWPLPLRMCERVSALYPQGFDHIIEPSAGTGPFIAASKMVWPAADRVAVDISDQGKMSCLAAGADSFVADDWQAFIRRDGCLPRTLIVGNPPFSLAHEHIMAALQNTEPGTVIAMLLRVSFLSGKYRCEQGGIYPTGAHKFLVPIVGRPVFVTTEKAKNDTTEYGLFIWETGYDGYCYVPKERLFWRDKKIATPTRRRRLKA